MDKNDKDAAWDVFKELVPIIDFLGDHLYVHGMKAAFKMMGRNMGNPRPPRLPLPKTKEDELRTVLKDSGLLDLNLPPIKD